ncbi:GDP-L-fucose synthase [Sphingobacterium sp. HJSM2_6]|uniref:GDP-L-fucose synthase n=1 Tax=Sphingobacterium sp. HJSM2_6 TaxID=3366264 RepID=UPI003BD1F6D1
MKKALILGCGWLAEDLAFTLKNKNWEIWATTTTPEKYHRLKNDGIFIYLHDFDQEENLLIHEFPIVDLLIISVPATQKNTIEQIDQRFQKITQFISQISYTKAIFFSSIGIYPDLDMQFREELAQDYAFNAKLSLAEKYMFKLPNLSVFRLAGLFGKNRIFAKYFQQRICTTGDQPANFIHIEDVIGLIQSYIAISSKSDIYNLVAPDHPSKRRVIEASAAKYQLDLPAAFEPQNSFQKIVHGDKIIKLLNYTFKYPSPLDF